LFGLKLSPFVAQQQPSIGRVPHRLVDQASVEASFDPVADCP
jgi:hypothetical protein